MKIVTDPSHPVQETVHAWIPLPDGRRLAARIWRPEGAGPVPAILEYLPYRRRDGTHVRDALTHPWLAGHGYACVRVDIAGTGDSDGLFDDEYSEQEIQDGLAVIDWIAVQDWCSGAVGMTGISWGGFNGLQLAARAPDALKAVVSICSTTDRYADDIHYKGGCMLGENIGWASTVLGWFGLPPDPETRGADWREEWLKRLEATPFLASDWLRNQTRGDYWRHGSVCEDYAAIKAAVLTVGGHHDGYRNTMSHLAANLSAPVKAICGPWNHKYPHFARPEPTIGFLQEMKRWYDRWLKEEENGAEALPAQRIYLMDAVPPADHYDERPGRWIAEAEWPSPAIANRQLHLTSEGLADAPGPCAAEAKTDLLCGEATGEYFPFGFGPGELPGDQQADDARSACFEIELDGADIVGAPRLSLTVAADAPRAQVAARLSDIAPDGRATLITHGFLNLRQRESREHPEDLPPGAPVDAAFDLDFCAYRLPPGHRLRLAISPSYWPFIWPEPELTTLSITGGALHLPVRPRASGAEWTFEPPESAPPLDIKALTPKSESKETTTDPDTGERLTTIFSDSGEEENPDTGTIARIVHNEHWRITPDDPLSARADFEWERTLRRGDWRVRTVAHVSQWADKTHFHVAARLTAWEGDREIFDRTYQDAVPRA